MSNESSGFWGGVLLGGLAAGVMLKVMGGKKAAPPAPSPEQVASQRRAAAQIAAQQQMAGMSGMDHHMRNGIPTIPLPAESAQRTAQAHRYRPSAPPPPAPSRSNPASPDLSGGHGAYDESFGGEGLGGETF